jgi:hypothetical protein
LPTIVDAVALMRDFLGPPLLPGGPLALQQPGAPPGGAEPPAAPLLPGGPLALRPPGAPPGGDEPPLLPGGPLAMQPPGAAQLPPVDDSEAPPGSVELGGETKRARFS